MVRPPYAALRSKYPDRHSVSAEEFYMWIGHPDLAKAVGWENTCGLRMSMGLVRVGVHVAPGRLRVQTGECNGQMLEPGQANLSRFLQHAWGEPEKYNGGPVAYKGIGAPWRDQLLPPVGSYRPAGPHRLGGAR